MAVDRHAPQRTSGGKVTPAELKQARHSLGLSAAKLAKAVGVASDRTVRRWEHGDRRIPDYVIAWVRAALK